MSGQYSAAISFVCLIAIGLAAREADVDNGRHTRAPASVSKHEMLVADLRPHDLLVHTEKVHGPLQAAVEQVGPSASVGETFVLRASVLASENLSDVEYQWGIPKGVEVVNGALNGKLDSVTANQPAQLEITLRKLVASNQKIHFNAKSTPAVGYGFSDTAQFNTELQEMIKARNFAAKSATKSARKASGGLKVFH